MVNNYFFDFKNINVLGVLFDFNRFFFIELILFFFLKYLYLDIIEI